FERLANKMDGRPRAAVRAWGTAFFATAPARRWVRALAALTLPAQAVFSRRGSCPTRRNMLYGGRVASAHSTRIAPLSDATELECALASMRLPHFLRRTGAHFG